MASRISGQRRRKLIEVNRMNRENRRIESSTSIEP